MVDEAHHTSRVNVAINRKEIESAKAPMRRCCKAEGRASDSLRGIPTIPGDKDVQCYA